MEQLEIDEYINAKAQAKQQQMDDIFDAFTKIANAPYQPNTLLMSPAQWQIMLGVQKYHRRRDAQLNRRKKRKRKRGY